MSLIMLVNQQGYERIRGKRMQRISKGLMFILFIGIVLLLAACGGDGSVKKVGVSQFVEHASLDEAYRGFQQALEDAGLEVEFDFQSAKGDFIFVNPISQ